MMIWRITPYADITEEPVVLVSIADGRPVMKKVVTVGGALFGDAEAEDRVNFATWSALAAVMSDKRLELLQHLRRRPAESIRQLAQALGRDYKRVYEDVDKVETAGLIDRDGEGRLVVLWSEIRTVVRLDQAA